MTSITEIINELDDIAPLPKPAMDLLALTNDIHANAGKATEILMKDPALSMKVLKAANSAQYGYTRHIATVSQAVVILGFKGLRNLILGLAVYKFLDDKSSPYGNHLWRHLLITGCLAKMITQKLGQEDAELGFLCGLIHDIGKAVLLSKKSEIYNELLSRAEAENIPINELEENFLGFTHADLGREICRSWFLPTILVKVVSLHHNKFIHRLGDSEDSEILKTVILADNLSKLYSISNQHTVSFNLPVLDLHLSGGIDQKFLEKCFEELPDEIRKLEGVFPGVFSIESADLKAKIKISNDIHQRAMSLFLLGKGFHLTDSLEEADIFLTDNKEEAASEKGILCDFFTNDTHQENKVLFTNNLNDWLKEKNIIAD